MGKPRFTSGVLREFRRGWALVRSRERRRLRFALAYGVVIAGLDTLALLLLFALITLLDGQPVSGVAGLFVQKGHLSSQQRYHDALVLLVLAALLFVLRSLLSIFGLWLTTYAVNQAQADLISRILLGHAHAPYLTRLERNSSETLRTVSMSIDQVMNGVVGGSILFVSNAAVAIAVALGLLLASPVVAVTVGVYFLALTIIWIRGVRGGLLRRGRQVQGLQEERFRLILEGIAAAKELQLRGRGLLYAEEAVARTRAINAATRGFTVVNGSLRYVLETSLVVGAMLILGAADLAGGRGAALAAVGLVLAAAFRLLPALNQILFLYNQVQYNSPALALVEDELRTFDRDLDALVGHTGAGVAPVRLHDALRLEGVTFQYPTRSDPALSGVSFSVGAGESVGILGPTGSGKSTLLDIVLGFIPVEAGAITVDGVAIEDCREAWQRSIGYVPQDVYLVDDSIRANVALGWRGADIDDEAVEAAIRLAQLEDVVRELPAGLETVVGERGVRLSGGQRQRLGLARALYARPSVLVLDEATSNLDVATEKRIVQTLAELRAGITTILVTHRISTVRDCDRVVYLEKGTVRFAGSFGGLAAFMDTTGNPGLVDAVGAETG
jgi:ABC-type multidrug transport system fused ATPase/permease subunit